MPAVVICLVLLGMLILYLLLLAGTAGARRQTRRRVVIGQVAAIMRQNLPLGPALAVAAQSESGRIRSDLKRVSLFVCSGMTLSEAVNRGFPDCPALVLSLIMAGERAGQLPAALDQAEKWLADQQRWRERVDPSVWTYALVVGTAMLVVVSFLLVMVIPKFEEIYRDFHTVLPACTVLVIELGDILQGVIGLAIPLVLILTPLVAYWRWRPRRVPDPDWVTRVADSVRWRIPGLRKMQRAEGLATMFRAMRFCAAAGLPLDRSALLAADLDANQHVRQRMRRFAELLNAGSSADQAARVAGLGRMASLALAAGQRRGNMDAALRYAADYHEALISRWWIVLGNLAWPLCTLVLATMIGTVVLSMILPLVALLDSIAWI